MIAEFIIEAFVETQGKFCLFRFLASPKNAVGLSPLSLSGTIM